MKTHYFKIVLVGRGELTEDDANALYESGCDDCLPGESDGVATCSFHREAACLEDALRTAIADIRKAGFEPERIELDPADLKELLPGPVAAI